MAWTAEVTTAVVVARTPSAVRAFVVVASRDLATTREPDVDAMGVVVSVATCVADELELSPAAALAFMVPAAAEAGVGCVGIGVAAAGVIAIGVVAGDLVAEVAAGVAGIRIRVGVGTATGGRCTVGLAAVVAEIGCLGSEVERAGGGPGVSPGT